MVNGRQPIEAGDLDPATMANECPEEQHPIKIVITEKDKDRLREDAEGVDTLENIYSLTCVSWPSLLTFPLNIHPYSDTKTAPRRRASSRRKSRLPRHALLQYLPQHTLRLR